MPCAYCSNAGPLTRDHVWPACFLDRQGRHGAHFSTKSGRVHGADYTVNDVCHTCNNEILSALDAYFCQLYDRYFSEPRDFGTIVHFEYDYALLVRTLLKIAYNSARTGATNPAPLAALKEFILGKPPVPTQIAVVAELVSPTRFPSSEAHPNGRTVLPTLYRSVVTQFTGPGGEDLHTRIIAVNSFYFHLLVPEHQVTNPTFHAAITSFTKSIDGTVLITPTASAVTLRTSPQDGITSMIPHLKAHSDQYERFFAKRRGE